MKNWWRKVTRMSDSGGEESGFELDSRDTIG